MSKQSRQYLVTGGAGFIGSNFVRYLYETHENICVRVLDKLTYSGHPANLRDFKKCAGFEFIKGDICDAAIVRKAMKGMQVVVNFAAESAVDRSIDDPQAFIKTDIFGVYTLLEEARRHKQLQRFVQISTDEVYGQILEGSFTEESQTYPRNPYSASKLGGERLAYSFFATYGLPVVISRASNNYGPRCYPEKVIPLFITNLIDGLKVPVYGKGKQVRDWLYVEDHCRAVDLLIRKGINGEVYNIGSEQESTNIDLVYELLKLFDKKKSSIKFVQDRPGHDFRYSLDCFKIRKLGWRPRYDLEKGLQETVRWYKDNESWWRPIKRKMDRRYKDGFWGQKR
ncbi:MAG: dTDP-glucose 4,6-dehydratase [Candidatus Omnitrophica bacterium]|nr:dTDP-glucose 4,6-dehydratase [Candidatus Omnitrophota bacterium]